MTTGSGALPYLVLPLAEVLDGTQPALGARVRERLSAFECARSSHLQDFARSNVHRFEGHGHSRTYVFITEDGPTDIDVPAFFTVGMTSLDLSQASKTQKKKLSVTVS